MYHGISAFNRAGKVYDIVDRVRKLASVVACYSDRPIGPIGVYCDIEHSDHVEYISDRDVFSSIDENGNRNIERTSASDEADVWHVQDGDDLYSLFCEYSRKADLVKRNRRYSEIAAKASAEAIWVDPSFGFVWVKRARVLARKFGLIVMFVKSV